MYTCHLYGSQIWLAPWSTKYFKLKEYEIWNVHKGLSGLSSEAGYKTLIWEVTFLYPEEKNIFISKDEGTQWNLNKQALVQISPRVLHIVQVCLIPFHDFPLLIKPSILTFRLNHFFRFHFLWRLQHYIKLTLSKFVCSSVVNLAFATGVPLRIQKGKGRRYFSSPTCQF